MKAAFSIRDSHVAYGFRTLKIPALADFVSQNFPKLQVFVNGLVMAIGYV